MKVQSISIAKWRHFENVQIVVPKDSSVVCVIGGNGTGKSHVLELIASCAHVIGLTQGVELMRGFAFEESAEFEVEFYIEKNTFEVDPWVWGENEPWPHLEEHLDSWDGTIKVRANGTDQIKLAGGVPNDQASPFAERVIHAIRENSSANYLHLDADRSYPHLSVAPQDLGQAFQTNWESQRKQRSHASTKGLYDEWFKYLLGTEGRSNSEFIASIRMAKANGLTPPDFEDPMEAYRDSVRAVLPHLLFTGIDSSSRSVTFNSTGIDLNFSQLSGGEREIAFLIGQIDRFGLRRGLLLVDEPELHLNPELLRRWVEFLSETIEIGQVWLATHAIDVVEVVGTENSILLERDEDRKVRAASNLSDRPLISALTRAVGSPAFSISKLKFVFVEGTQEIGERERFRRLAPKNENVRFLEGGSCNEVMKKLEAIKLLSAECSEPIDAVAVLDRDWRSESEVSALENDSVFVLDVHEVENLFLHPEVCQKLFDSLDVDEDYSAALTAVCDELAALWIFRSARSDQRCKKYPPYDGKVTSELAKTRWAEIAENDEWSSSIAQMHSGLDETQRSTFEGLLNVNRSAYARLREDGETLWKRCEGKDVIKLVAKRAGMVSAARFERAFVRKLGEFQDIPVELAKLRQFVEK